MVFPVSTTDIYKENTIFVSTKLPWKQIELASNKTRKGVGRSFSKIIQLGNEPLHKKANIKML